MEKIIMHRKVTLMCGLTVALAIFVTTLCVDAYPIYEASDMREITEEDVNMPTQCQLHSGTEILCQRCAKSTKSSTLYPMCCGNMANVQEWCEKYLNFGIHK
jgi:hypothetical protein